MVLCLPAPASSPRRRKITSDQLFRAGRRLARCGYGQTNSHNLPSDNCNFVLSIATAHFSPPDKQLPRAQSVKMAPSNLPAIFNPTQQDIEMLLAAQCHLGAKNLQVHMEPYLWKTRADGVNVLNVGKTWEKIVLAARIIAAIDNPADSTWRQFDMRKFEN